MPELTLDDEMVRFKLASRDLFNRCFYIKDPYNNGGWALEERFVDVQQLLFEKMIIQPFNLPKIVYGDPNPAIRLQLRGVSSPILINREINSGYWDFPLNIVTKEAHLSFLCFFDWDQLTCRDNQYVRVRIEEWAEQDYLVGKHALIESQCVSFAQNI